MSQAIDGELGRALKVAGLPWRPRRGDRCMDRLGIYWIVLADGPAQDGGVEAHNGAVIERRHVLGLCWLPRPDDLLTALHRYGPVTLTGADGRWACTVGDTTASGGSPADAAGRALLALLA